MQRERRYAPTEFVVRARAGDPGGAVIEGHGAVFNRLSRNLGGFVERVDPAAFDVSLRDRPDVRALINHDPSHLLGRTLSGTLRIATDSTGLAYEVDVPDRQDARDLVASMERGDLDQSSFAFDVLPDGDDWALTEQGMPLRTLTRVSIHNGDVSPVTYPAYEAADSGIAGRAFARLAETRGVDLAVITAAAASRTLASIITGEADPAEELRATRSPSALAVARARLELLRRQAGLRATRP